MTQKTVLLVAAAALNLGCFAVSSAIAEEFPTPLPVEELLNIKKLPAKYPTGWAFLNYSTNRIELRNVGADSREVKGNLQSRDSATLLVSDTRPEIYVADTVWSRGTRGVRTDFISIYDRETLNPIGEIVLPGAKRGLMTAMEGMFAFIDDQKMALVFDLTPQASVTVVDLVNRKVLGDIEIPGCALVYPTGKRGFSTLCASGTMLSVQLDANGALVSRSETKVFNPLDSDPLFTASAELAGIRYFPSFHGRIQAIDLRGDAAKILADWPLVPVADLSGNWRPSGWQILASDEHKQLYVLMQRDGHEGTHKEPANEVWVYDAASKTRVRRLPLVRPGSSLALTHGAEALMLVQAGERLDVYDLKGALLRSLDLPGFTTRMQIEPLR